jgi:hypothetical protein
MNLNTPWWESDQETAHSNVFKALNNITKNQTAQQDLDERHFRLYSGLPLYSAFTFSTEFESGDVKFTMNVVQACVNTLVSKITKNKVRPTFLTDGGDWGMQQQAKKLDKYVYGRFYKSKVYEETKRACRDALIFGDGFVKHWHDKDGEIHVKRVFKPCVIIDQAETLYGQEPRTIHEIRIVDKDVLKQKYPDFAKEIEEANISDIPYFVDNYEAGARLCAVVESYKVATKVSKKGVEVMVPGKHFIGISTATFLWEDFKQDKVPYKRIQYVPNAIGYFSKGVAELITGHQVEINRTLRRISRAMNLMSSPSIFIDYMSEVIDTHFNNEVGSIIKFKNNPPIYNYPQGISPVVIEWFLTVYQKAFEEVGLSQLTAQSQKPSGLDSGKALREYNDIETERYAEFAQNWEQFHLDIADAIVIHSKEIADQGGPTIVLSPEKYGALKIDFKKIKLKDSEYIMQVYPTSMLPKTPAGRLAYVQEMLGAQLLTPEEGLQLLEFPDTAELIETKNAYIDDIRYTANQIIEDSLYNPPEPYQRLDYGIAYMNSMYLKMKTRGLPTEKLDLLQKWINDALTLQESMQAPPPEQAMLEEMPTETPDLLSEELPQEITQGV